MNKEKTSGIFDSFLIGSFLVGLFLPLFLTHTLNVSQIEKRKLAKFPALKWDTNAIATFPTQFEAFFKDRFGLRDQFVQIYSLYSVFLKSSSNPQVLIGVNDWLFYINSAEGNSLEDYRRNDPLAHEELKSWKTGLEAKYRWLKQQGIRYLFVIVPDKYSIYPEYMPSHIRHIGKQTRLEQLLEYMQDSEVPILDLRPRLLRAKTQGQLFYKTDTHWNDFGAAIAQQEIVRSLQKYFPNLVPIEYGFEDFRLTEYSSGDLANMLNISYFLREMAPELRKAIPACPKQILEERPEDPSKATFFTNCQTSSQTGLQTNMPKPLKALIFRDSFFIALQPYISQYFGKTMYVWEWPDLHIMKKYLEYDRPDLVIEARVERHLKFVPTFSKP
jgi:alginate O-acetyltransferase complex protein AlgJ